MGIRPLNGGGSSGAGSLAIPSDLRFTGATLLACQSARDTFFTNNPTRKIDGVTTSLEPTGVSATLSRWNATNTSWADITATIKGPKGDAGAAGANGTNGTNGTNGVDGVSPTVAVGTVTTGAAGSSASVVNSGTSSNVVLNFTIPRGDAGSGGSGSGDMDKATYDPNDDGKIDIAQTTGFGTAASRNVAASGDASSSEVVKGNDTRLADARTPLTHTHVVADTTGLQAALNLKVNVDGAKVLSDENFTTAEKTKLGNMTDHFKGLFANAAARDIAVPAPYVGDCCLQEDTDTTWYYSTSNAWVNTGSSSSGDMLSAIFDPRAVNGDAFLMSNMTEDTNAKILTAAERTKLAGIEAGATNVASSDDLTEGGINLFHTSNRVRDTLLNNGLSFLTQTAIVATDSIITAFGKLQGQLNKITSFGWSLVASNDDAAARSTLGAVSSVNPTTSGTQIHTGASRIRGAYAEQYFDTVDGTNAAAISVDTADKSLNIYTNGSSRIKTLSSGRILMGATLPADNGADALQVNGSASVLGVMTNRSTSTPNTGSDGRYMGGAYSGNRATGMYIAGTSSGNFLTLGGGTSAGEPATTISFNIGAIGTVGAGTTVATFAADGMQVAGTAKLNGLVNAGAASSTPWATMGMEVRDQLRVFDKSGTSFGLRVGFNSNVPYLQGYRETVGPTALAIQPSGGVVNVGGSIGLKSTLPATAIDRPTYMSGNGALLFGTTYDLSNQLTSNVYHDGAGWKYVASGYGSMLRQSDGSFTFFYVGTSGAANGAAAITQGMQLARGGRLVVGSGTDNGTDALQVTGDAKFTGGISTGGGVTLKHKYLTVVMGAVGTNVSVTHGLDIAKIIGAQILVEDTTGALYPTSYAFAGSETVRYAGFWITSTVVCVVTGSAATQLVGKTARILVTYQA